MRAHVRTLSACAGALVGLIALAGCDTNYYGSSGEHTTTTTAPPPEASSTTVTPNPDGSVTTTERNYRRY